MRLLKSTLFMALVTMIALLYVHQQIELVKLSYAIDFKEKRLKDILDHNEGLGYNIENLESPSRLEQALLSKNIDVSYPKRGQVVSGTGNLKQPAQFGRDIGLHKKADMFGFFEFFSLRAEAQAREK